jgi:Flp pilus assembly protein TadB
VARTLLVGLIVAATAGFIVGTTIERNSGDEHTKRRSTVEPTAQRGGEAGEAHKEAGESTAAHSEELRPLGVDVEAAPFVALAAAASLALALGAWLRPHWLPLLVVIALAMLLFAALDVREVVHQSDEGKTGLAILAGVVAVLHMGAAGTASIMSR